MKITKMMSLTGVFVLLLCTAGFAQCDEPQFGENSIRQKNVPTGTVTKHLWKSKIYDGTVREYYLYVPAQYDAKISAALMVFQDGHAYVKDDGSFRTSIVFDNLIHKKEMPVTIGLFINPGHNGDSVPENPFRASNRSREYDELSDTYATFLIDELIPEIQKQYNISDDPKMHAIGGLSSGAICAFTVAWQRPDYFHKVLSHIGSYTNINGGHTYPSLIRMSSKKDIRIFLQDGSNDLDNRFGNWWLSNLQMVAALKFRDYDHQFVSGSGGHTGEHGGEILPESLKWLWRDAEK